MTSLELKNKDMSYKPIRMDVVEKIIEHHLKGTPKKKIARLLHVSKNTVKSYIKRYESTAQVDEKASSLYSDLEVLRDQREVDIGNRLPGIVGELGKVGVTRFLLWEEYKVEVPNAYSYSRFCQHLRDYKARTNTTIRIEHRAAYRLTVDYAGKKLKWVDIRTGEVHYCEVLVCTLPYSGYTFAIAVNSQKQEDFIAAINSCLLYLGGCPKVILSDNLKSYVSKPDRYEPSFTKLCMQFSVHYGIELEATRVAKPKDKGHVERHVAIVYNQVYAPLRDHIFHSLEELNQAVLKQLEVLNKKKYQGKEYSREEKFTQYEKPHLCELPTTMFEPQRSTSAKVQRNCHIILGEDKHQYSVPYQYVGKQTEVIYTSATVEVYQNGHRIAAHKRDRRKHGYTSNVSHMPEKDAKYKEQMTWDAEYFEKWAGDIGQSTVWAINYILQSKSLVEQTYNSCIGVLRFAKSKTPQRLEAACARARSSSKVNYGIIKNILNKNLDKLPPVQQSSDFKTPDHDNIRGANQYN